MMSSPTKQKGACDSVSAVTVTDNMFHVTVSLSLTHTFFDLFTNKNLQDILI